MRAPKAPKVPYQITSHGDRREDPYHWLQERDDPKVLEYLAAENTYTDKMMKRVAPLQDRLFEELCGRLEPNDETVPAKDGPYWYWSRYEKDAEYRVYLRADNAKMHRPEVILDVNELARGHEFFHIGALEWSPNHRYLAYSVDLDGSEKYTLYIKDLKTGALLNDVIPDTYSAAAWSSDSKTIFYTRLNENLRPYQILRHRLGTDPSQDKVVLEEADNGFFLELWQSLSGRFLFVQSHSADCSEMYFAPANGEGEFHSFMPRKPGVEYYAEHQGERFLLLTNENAIDFRLMETPVATPQRQHWKDLIPHQQGRLIDDFIPFQNHLVLFLKENATYRVEIRDIGSDQVTLVPLPETLCSVSKESNYEYEANVLRLRYSSMITPWTVFDWHFRSGRMETKKVQKIPSGYDKDQYTTDRLWATAPDGKQVPMTILHRRDVPLDGRAPVYLYSYGSYGIGLSPQFSTNWLSLTDRGFIVALAHVRGGDDLGRTWYEDGKLGRKMNTFTDYIACAEHLIAAGYTRNGRIFAVGGSAGGMLVGAVVNMRPELFGAVVAHVPFVDCINTMLNENLPLTPREYTEWGNPNEEDAYGWIRKYSPYDNIKAQKYPHMLVTAGLNDPRVTYWEPAKWVARLRELKTDGNLLLLKTNMGAGHMGHTGRYESLREKALEYAFLLMISQEQTTPNRG